MPNKLLLRLFHPFPSNILPFLLILTCPRAKEWFIGPFLWDILLACHLPWWMTARPKGARGNQLLEFFIELLFLLGCS